MASSSPISNWYDLSQPDANYAHAVCRWGAGLAATSKALAAMFERMAEHQLQSTQELARVSRDPNRFAQAYADYGARMLQMQAEMQGTMEKLQRDADLLYEGLRRSLDDAASAPLTSPLGAPSVAPAMKYGASASEGADGPGGWRFDPGQRLPGPDNQPAGPAMPSQVEPGTIAPAAVPPAAASSSPWPSLPYMPPLPPMPWVNPPAPATVTADESAASRSAAIRTTNPLAGDVQETPGQARQASPSLPSTASLPPAPTSVYPAPSTSPAAASAVSYRCGGYRRVARAKP